MYSKLKYIFLMVLIGSAVFLSSCADDPSSVGVGLLDPNDYITLNADSSIETQSASFFKTETKLSASDRLLLGKYGNLEASMLVQFALSTLPDSTRSGLIDGTLSIKSATVEMSPVYTLGSGSASFDFSVHQIKNKWSQNFTSDSLNAGFFDASELKSSDLKTTDTLYTFDLNKNTVASWLKDTSYTNSRNYGLYFQPGAASAKIVGFQALALTLTKPIMKMSVVFSKQGRSDYTITFNDNNDLHTIKATLPQEPASSLVVQGGIAVSSKFQISTANIPHDAIINSAILELTVDTLHSAVGNPASNTLIVQFLTNNSTNSYDSIRTTALTRSGNVFSGNIAQHLQRWLDGTANNGLMISLGNEPASGDLYTFKGSGTADRPRLIILYTAKKK